MMRDNRTGADTGVVDGTKQAFTTRRVNFGHVAGVTWQQAPRAGDLVLCEVLEVSQHKTLHGHDGRRRDLYAGDAIVVVFGNRYAPDQFEAEVPPGLDECHLVAAGGIAGVMRSCHARMAPPTRIAPRGLLARRDGRVLNVADYALPQRVISRRPPVLAVLGSSMNSGKTTAAARLIRGLARAGHRVGAAKVTGTGAAADVCHFRDAGAPEVLDFTDCGFATTYRVGLEALLAVFQSLVAELALRDVDAIVLEVADGLFQPETEALLAEPLFRRHIDQMVFAAQDSLGAVLGERTLAAAGLPLAALTGVFTQSALAMRETTGRAAVPVLHTETLAEPARATALLHGAVTVTTAPANGDAMSGPTLSATAQLTAVSG